MQLSSVALLSVAALLLAAACSSTHAQRVDPGDLQRGKSRYSQVSGGAGVRLCHWHDDRLGSVGVGGRDAV